MNHSLNIDIETIRDKKAKTGVKSPYLNIQSIRPSTTASPGSRSGGTPISLRQRIIEHDQRERSQRLRKTKKRKKKPVNCVFEDFHIVFLHDLLEISNDALEYMIGIIPTFHKFTKKNFIFTLYHHLSVKISDDPNYSSSYSTALEHLQRIQKRLTKRMQLQRTSFEIRPEIGHGSFSEQLLQLNSNMIVCRANSKHRVGHIPKMIFAEIPQVYLFIVPFRGYRPRISAVVFLSQISEQEMYMIRSMSYYTNIIKMFNATTVFLSLNVKNANDPPPMEKSSSFSKLVWEGISKVTHQLLPHSHKYHTSNIDHESNVGSIEAPSTMITSPSTLNVLTMPARPSTTHGSRSPSLKPLSPLIEPPPFTSPLVGIDTSIEFKARNYESVAPMVRFAQSNHADLIALVRHHPVDKSTPVVNKIINSKKEGYFNMLALYPILIMPGYF